MLNPAGAFIKACKMIYDVVMFFVERAAQIKEFVDAVLDSVESIAAGGVGAVAAKIEDTLGKLVPILIGFLASLLGLGGISDKIKKILEMVQKPVMKVVDWVIGKAVGIGKRLIGVAKRVGGKIKAGAKKLTAKVRRTVGGRRPSAALSGEPPRSADDKGRLAQAAANATLERAKSVPARNLGAYLSQSLGQWSARGLRGLRLVEISDGTFGVEASVNPKATSAGHLVVGTSPHPLTVEEANPRGRNQPSYSRGSLHVEDRSRYIHRRRSTEPSSLIHREIDAHADAHAEEQVVLAMRKELTKLPTQTGLNITIEIEVNRSSCPNCAHYIANFIEQLRQGNNQVVARMRFGGIYSGGRDPANPTVLPESTVASLGRPFIDHFLSSPLPTTKVAADRRWGSLAETSGTAAGPGFPMRGGHDQGRLGLAILLRAGVQVSALRESDLDQGSVGAASTQERHMLTRQAKAFERILLDVKKDLKAYQAGQP
ncbi:MAG: hypothetical protein WCG47_16020, partial [Dermatophilaceae bacterium]